MDLHALAWMVRDAGQPAGCVRLLDDHRVLAGGWDGDVRCWDAEGNLLWSASTPDRVSAITPWGDAVALTSGLHVVVLDLATGTERWSRPLEGSADLQCVLGDHLLTTSSVYDIEHFDFLESAAWLHDRDGNELHVERLDERPWALAQQGSEVLLGLGRPRGGLLATTDGRTFEHRALGHDAPVLAMAGTGDGLHVLLADGTLLHNDQVVAHDLPDAAGLTDLGSALLLHGEHGHVLHLGDAGWSANGDVLTSAGALGDHLVLARHGPTSSSLHLHARNGTEEVQVASSRVHAMHGDGTRLVLGTEGGDVVVLEAGMVARRLAQAEDEADSNGQEVEDAEAEAHRQAMRARLRALRD